MTFRILYPFMIVFLTVQVSVAQPGSYITKRSAEGKVKKIFEKGMAYNMQENYSKALLEFGKVIQMEPKFIDAHILYANIQYDLKDYEKARQSFKTAIDIDANYRPNVLYNLALTEKKLRNFDEAKKYFESYIQHEKAREAKSNRARKHIETCDFMEYAYANPVPFAPEALSDNINTAASEYLPCFTADEETLIYTVRQNRNEDFYISKKIKGEWQIGKPLTAINTNFNEGAQSISADGKYLVFTACDRPDGLGSCDLYFAEVKRNKWTDPIPMDAPVNHPGWDSQPSLSADGRSLFFASARPGGNGDYDLWLSQKNSKGVWSTPVNLGDSINTRGREQSPFIHPDGETLYFMSDGHIGMGGSDLFISRKGSDGEWGKPVNLGYPINTEAHEGALVISLDGRTAYFASDRKMGDGTAEVFGDEQHGSETDIYSFALHAAARPKPVTYVKAKVFDAQTKKELLSKVEFIELSSGEVHASSLTDLDGEFLVCLPLGKNYSLNVAKEQYIFHSENFALRDSNPNSAYVLEIGLQKIPETLASISEPEVEPSETRKPIILRNVFFDTGSAVLRPESFIELDRLRALLVDNPGLRIQINGHTDNVGSDQDNLTLSDNRAKAVYNYLIDTGIEAERLKYKGYGETQSIDTNETPLGRQKNRRTEFVILN